MAGKTPRVSVLMLTYNRPRTIGRAVASVLAQTFTEWEIVIVQDGNNPETAQILAEYLQKDARIRYFWRQIAGSIAEASNFGLERAQGEYIAILDDDDAWSDPGKLARQVEFLDTHPDYIGCGGGYSVGDGDGRDRGVFLKPENDAAIRARALMANPMVNSTGMFRRTAGGRPIFYDTAIRQFADWDFWLTAGTVGKLYNFPCPFAHYVLWEGGSSFVNQRANARAAVRIVCKHRRAYRGFPAALAIALLYWCYSLFPLWIRRFSYNWLSALKKAAAGQRAASSLR